MKNISKGKWGIDSHFLVYALDADSSFHSDTKALIDSFIQLKIELVIAQQNILEAERVFITVYKQDPSMVISALMEMITALGVQIVHPLSTTHDRYHQIVKSAVAKIDIFDYYLAATFIDHGISRLLTLNIKDFAGIKGFEVVNPFDHKYDDI